MTEKGTLHEGCKFCDDFEAAWEKLTNMKHNDMDLTLSKLNSPMERAAFFGGLMLGQLREIDGGAIPTFYHICMKLSDIFSLEKEGDDDENHPA